MSQRFNATYTEVLTHWSVRDVRAALELIEVHEEAEAKMQLNARRG